MSSGYIPHWYGHFTFLDPFVHHFKNIKMMYIFRVSLILRWIAVPIPAFRRVLFMIFCQQNSDGCGKMDVMKQCDVSTNTRALLVFQGQTLCSGCWHIWRWRIQVRDCRLLLLYWSWCDGWCSVTWGPIRAITGLEGLPLTHCRGWLPGDTQPACFWMEVEGFSFSPFILFLFNFHQWWWLVKPVAQGLLGVPQEGSLSQPRSPVRPGQMRLFKPASTTHSHRAPKQEWSPAPHHVVSMPRGWTQEGISTAANTMWNRTLYSHLFLER